MKRLEVKRHAVGGGRSGNAPVDAELPREGDSGAAKDVAALRLILLEAERSLLDGSTRASRPRLEALLTQEFVEVGASGRRYSRSQTIEALAGAEGASSGAIDDFHLMWHDDDAALVSYRYAPSSQAVGSKSSFRISFWVREGSTWKILYHQGTPTMSAETIT